jgi:hypothetical protein
MNVETQPHEIVELEQQYWSAIERKDADAAVQLTDHACIVAGPKGVRRLDRDALPALLREQPTDVRDVRIGPNVQVRMITEDVAVVAYDMHSTLTVDGKVMTVAAVDASTWVRRDGQWRCALHMEAIKDGGAAIAHDEKAGATPSGLRSQIAQVVSAMPHLRYGSAVSPSMPDAVEEPDPSAASTPRQGDVGK